MSTRTSEEYDQSMISSILILPTVVTSIVIVVQGSLALAFALGGIAGAVRFKNSLKSSGDALYILLSVGIGLASGIGAVELAFVMSLAFNVCFVTLWITEYGEREGMKRYMTDFDPLEGPPPARRSGGPPTAADAGARQAAATAARLEAGLDQFRFGRGVAGDIGEEAARDKPVAFFAVRGSSPGTAAKVAISGPCMRPILRRSPPWPRHCGGRSRGSAADGRSRR